MKAEAMSTYPLIYRFIVPVFRPLGLSVCVCVRGSVVLLRRAARVYRSSFEQKCVCVCVSMLMLSRSHCIMTSQSE